MIKLCRGNLLIEMLREEDNYSDLVVKPDNYKDIGNRGKVIAQGEGCTGDIPLGAEIIIDVMDAEEIKEHTFELNGKIMFIIRESWAICYFEEVIK